MASFEKTSARLEGAGLEAARSAVRSLEQLLAQGSHASRTEVAALASRLSELCAQGHATNALGDVPLRWVEGLEGITAIGPIDAVEGPVRTLPELRDARDAFERAYLRGVLQRTGGNVTAAAKLAGRNRTDFYELLHRRQVSPREFKQ